MEGGKCSHYAFRKNAEIVLFFYSWLFWRVENFTLPSYAIRRRPVPQVKRLLSAHPSQTSGWPPRVAMNTNSFVALYKVNPIQGWGFWSRRQQRSNPSLPILNGLVTVPLTLTFLLQKWGCKWGLSAIACVVPLWWTYVGCLPSTSLCLLTHSFGVFM